MAHRVLVGALEQLGRAQQRAAQHPALAVDVLGGRVDHDVGPELQGRLEERRREDIVHHHPGAGLAGDGADGGDVGDLQQGIGRALQEHRPGVRPHGNAPGDVHVRAVHQGRLDAEARRPGVDDPPAGAEQRFASHDVVAGREQAHQSKVHGRHARGERAAGLGALQQSQALLEHGHGRVAVAGVDESRLSV